MLKVNVGGLILLNKTLGRHDAVGSQQDLVWGQSNKSLENLGIEKLTSFS